MATYSLPLISSGIDISALLWVAMVWVAFLAAPGNFGGPFAGLLSCNLERLRTWSTKFYLRSSVGDALILFDPDHSWDERILTEQFKY